MAETALDREEEKWVGWVPLEANENALNEYLKTLGIKGAKCVELWSFDEQIPFLEKPHYGLILCYSNFVEVKKIMEAKYGELKPEIPESVFFAQQKIKNACGTFALIHAVVQNRDRIELGDGIFGKWLAAARAHAVDERSDILANDKAFAEAHAKCAGVGTTAGGGTTSASEVDQNPDSHYICYVKVGERLLEFDSRMNFPRDCGSTTEDTLLQDASKECKKLIDSIPNIQFSALALVGSNEI